MKRFAAIILIVILILALTTACSDGDQPPTVDELLAFGEQLLLDGDYGQALIQFMQVIEVEPMNPRGYTGAADAYVGLGEYDRAREVLEDGLLAIGYDADISAMLEDIRRVLEERRQAEIEAEVERRLAELELETALEEETEQHEQAEQQLEHDPNAHPFAFVLTEFISDADNELLSVVLVDLDGDGVDEMVAFRATGHFGAVRIGIYSLSHNPVFLDYDWFEDIAVDSYGIWFIDGMGDATYTTILRYRDGRINADSYSSVFVWDDDFTYTTERFYHNDIEITEDQWRNYFAEFRSADRRIIHDWMLDTGWHEADLNMILAMTISE